MECGLCGTYLSVSSSDMAVSSPNLKAKVLECFHVLCSQCLAEHVHAYPEEGVAAVTCPFCSEVTIKDLPPGYTASMVTSSPMAEASRAEQDVSVSRISSYDSDMSISNIDTTPVQYNTNTVDHNYDDRYTLEMDMVYSHLPDDILNCYEDSDGNEGSEQQTQREAENAAAPSLEDIYRHDESINDSTEIELEQESRSPVPAAATSAAGRGAHPHTPSASVRNRTTAAGSARRKTARSAVEAHGATLDTEGPSEAAWLQIALNLAVAAYAALIAVAGPEFLGSNGYFQVHTTLTVRRGLGALLVLHYLLQEGVLSAFSNIVRPESASGQDGRTSTVTLCAALTDATAVTALLALSTQELIQSGCTLLLQQLGEMLVTVDPVYRMCIIAVGAALMSTALVVLGVYICASTLLDSDAESASEDETAAVEEKPSVQSALNVRTPRTEERPPMLSEQPATQNRPAVPKYPSPERRRRKYAGVNPMKHRGKHSALGRAVKTPLGTGAHAEAEVRPAPQTAPAARPALGSLAERISRSAGDSRGRFRDQGGATQGSNGPPPLTTLVTPTKVGGLTSAGDEQLPIDAVSAHLAAQLLLRHAMATAPAAPLPSLSPPRPAPDLAARSNIPDATPSPTSYTRRIFEGSKFSYPSSPVTSPSPKRPPIALPDTDTESLLSPPHSSLPGVAWDGASGRADRANSTSSATTAVLSLAASAINSGASLTARSRPATAQLYSPLQSLPADEILLAAATPDPSSRLHGESAPFLQLTRATPTGAAAGDESRGTAEAVRGGAIAFTLPKRAEDKYLSGASQATRSHSEPRGIGARPTREASEKIDAASTVPGHDAAHMLPPSLSAAKMGANAPMDSTKTRPTAEIKPELRPGDLLIALSSPPKVALIGSPSAVFVDSNKRPRVEHSAAAALWAAVVDPIPSAMDESSLSARGHATEGATPERKKLKGWRSVYAYSPSSAPKSPAAALTPGRVTGEDALPSSGAKTSHSVLSRTSSFSSTSTFSAQAAKSLPGSAQKSSSRRSTVSAEPPNVNPAGVSAWEKGGRGGSQGKMASPQSIRQVRQSMSGGSAQSKTQPKTGEEFDSASGGSGKKSLSDKSTRKHEKEQRLEPTSYSGMFERRQSFVLNATSGTSPAASSVSVQGSRAANPNPPPLSDVSEVCANMASSSLDGANIVNDLFGAHSAHETGHRALHVKKGDGDAGHLDGLDTDSSSDTTYCSSIRRGSSGSEADSRDAHSAMAAKERSRGRGNHRRRRSVQQQQVSPAPPTPSRFFPPSPRADAGNTEPEQTPHPVPVMAVPGGVSHMPAAAAGPAEMPEEEESSDESVESVCDTAFADSSFLVRQARGLAAPVPEARDGNDFSRSDQQFQLSGTSPAVAPLGDSAANALREEILVAVRGANADIGISKEILEHQEQAQTFSVSATIEEPEGEREQCVASADIRTAVSAVPAARDMEEVEETPEADDESEEAPEDTHALSVQGTAMEALAIEESDSLTVSAHADCGGSHVDAAALADEVDEARGLSSAKKDSAPIMSPADHASALEEEVLASGETEPDKPDRAAAEHPSGMSGAEVWRPGAEGGTDAPSQLPAEEETADVAAPTGPVYMANEVLSDEGSAALVVGGVEGRNTGLAVPLVDAAEETLFSSTHDANDLLLPTDPIDLTVCEPVQESDGASPEVAAVRDRWAEEGQQREEVSAEAARERDDRDCDKESQLDVPTGSPETAASAVIPVENGDLPSESEEIVQPDEVHTAPAEGSPSGAKPPVDTLQAMDAIHDRAFLPAQPVPVSYTEIAEPTAPSCLPVHASDETPLTVALEAPPASEAGSPQVSQDIVACNSVLCAETRDEVSNGEPEGAVNARELAVASSQDSADRPEKSLAALDLSGIHPVAGYQSERDPEMRQDTSADASLLLSSPGSESGKHHRHVATSADASCQADTSESANERGQLPEGSASQSAGAGAAQAANSSEVNLTALAAMSASKLPAGVYTPQPAALPRPVFDNLPISPFNYVTGSATQTTPLSTGTTTGATPRSRSRIRASIKERVNGRLQRGRHSVTMGDLRVVGDNTSTSEPAMTPADARPGSAGPLSGLSTKEDVDRFEHELNSVFGVYLPSKAHNGSAQRRSPVVDDAQRSANLPSTRNSRPQPVETDTSTTAAVKHAPVAAESLVSPSESGAHRSSSSVMMVTTGTSPIRVLEFNVAIREVEYGPSAGSEGRHTTALSISTSELEASMETSRDLSSNVLTMQPAAVGGSIQGAIEAEGAKAASPEKGPVTAPAKQHSPLKTVMSTSNIANLINHRSRLMRYESSPLISPLPAGPKQGKISPVPTIGVTPAQPARSGMLKSASSAASLSSVMSGLTSVNSAAPQSVGARGQQRTTPSSLDCVSSAMDSDSSYLVLVHLGAALTTPRCVGKIAKCISSVLEKCQQRHCSVTVAVATPLSAPTALRFLYAVLSNKTSPAGMSSGGAFNSSGASISSTTSEGDYIVKSRSKPCWFHGGTKRLDAASADITVSERALRSALKDLLAPEAPALANLQAHSPTTLHEAKMRFDEHLRNLRTEMKTGLANFADTTDVVVVTDGAAWPFATPTSAHAQSGALAEWAAFRDSVPYLQLHFVAISTRSTKSSMSSMTGGK